MRTLEYLSPSSISVWIEDRDEFYLRYLADKRPPRPLQTRPMAAGSAFDAYVKSALNKALGGADPAYEFEALFESQVEEHNRDWARVNGKHIFDSYVELGAYDALLQQLIESEMPPRFEFEVKEPVTFGGETITFLGKPDLVYSHNFATVIVDWKVNGYCAKYAKTPSPGYIKIRGGRNSGKPHRDCVLGDHGGVTINTRGGLENVDKGWARQTSIYAWVLGAPVGSDFVCGIDQIVAKPATPYPEIRVAEHRYQIGSIFQALLFSTASSIRRAVANDHIFDDLSVEEDKKRRSALDQMSSAFDTSDPRDRLFLEMTR